MKNSVGLQEILTKKLDALPINEDMDAAWHNMSALLDQHLPVVQPGGMPSPQATQALSLLKPLLIIIATMAVVGYFVFRQPQAPLPKKGKKRELRKPQPDTILTHGIRPFAQPQALDQADTGGVTFGSGIHKKNQLQNNEMDGSVGQVFSSAIAKLKAQDSLRVQQPYQIADFDSAPVFLTELVLPKPTASVQVYHQVNGLGQIKLARKAKKKPSGKSNAQPNGSQLKRTKKTHVKTVIVSPLYNAELHAGIAMQAHNSNMYLGATAAYALKQRLLVQLGIRFQVAKKLQGSYSHPSYNLNQPAMPFTITDQRQFNAIEIPINLSYKISNAIQLKAGPFVRFAGKQQGGSKLAPIANPMDTLYHGKAILSALQQSKINKIHTGFSGGIQINLKQWAIEANYLQQFETYTITSELGGYRIADRTFLIGVSYRFK